MSRMFARAKFFDSDISRWDVSRVQDMRGMFLRATSFNGDLSKWDVSRVKDMHGMFLGARRFNQHLCTAAWVHSKARKEVMFEGSSASISSKVCTSTALRTGKVFSPRSIRELKSATKVYLRQMSEGAGADDWDVWCANKTHPGDQTEITHEKGQDVNSNTNLSNQERTLAFYLAKRPYYSYETAMVLDLMGMTKAGLVALAKSLGDKTGDQVNIFTFKGVEYIGLQSRKQDYDRDKAAGTNFIEEKIKRGDYDRFLRSHLGI